MADSEAAVDLSKEAIEKRAREQSLREAAHWARKMNTAFKGISRISRRGYVARALAREGLIDEKEVR